MAFESPDLENEASNIESKGAPPDLNDTEGCTNDANLDDDGEQNGTNQNDPEVGVSDQIEFVEGTTFVNFEDFETKLKVYCNQTFTHVFRRNSVKMKLEAVCKESFPYQRIEFWCRHGKDPNKVVDSSTSTSLRPMQSYTAKKCPFKFSLSFSKLKNAYLIKSFVNKHENHKQTKEGFMKQAPARNLSKNLLAKEMVQKLVNDLNVKKSKVKAEIKKTFGKEPTTKDIANVARQLRVGNKPSCDLQETLEKLTEQQAKDPGSSLVIVAEDQEDASNTNNIKMIYFQSSRMKKNFQRYGSVLLLDGTYSTSNKGYILTPLLTVDKSFATILIGWAFISNEKKEQLQEMLQTFKENNIDSENILKYVVVDKDMSEISSIKTVFPQVEFIICKWHAMMAVKKRVMGTTLNTPDQHYKLELVELFSDLVTAQTEELYTEKWNTICHLAPGNQSIDEIKTYLENHWHRIRQHWAFYLLKKKPLLGCFTNNRSENFNSQLKKQLEKKMNLCKTIETLFDLEKGQEAARRLQNSDNDGKTFMPTNITSQEKRSVLDICNSIVSKNVTMDILKQYDKIPLIKQDDLNLEKKQVKCPRNLGICTFNANYMLPCCHLMLARQINGETLIDRAMFSVRYLSQEDVQEENMDVLPREQPVVKKRKKNSSKSDRFNESTAKLRKMADLLSHCSDNQRNQYQSQLDILTNAWNKEQHTTIDITNPECSQSSVTVNSNLGEVDDGSERVNLVLSPKRQLNYSYKVKKDKRNTTARKNTTQETLTNDELSLNDHLMKMGASTRWTKQHFACLNEEKCADQWLSDPHFDFVNTLLKQQFPQIQALYNPISYLTDDFTAIDTSQDFIQACHAGDNHWNVITNIGIPSSLRANHMIVYDSLVTMQNGQPVVKSSIEWQMCQLYRKTLQEKNLPLVIIVGCCQQQTNGNDCGLFTVANMVSLAFGFSPSEMVYIGNKRLELYSMLKNRKIEMFLNELHTGENDHLFKQHTQIHGLPDLIAFADTKHMFETHCHCCMSESFGDLVWCDVCNCSYHQRCYLLSSAVASQINFVCYNCREPGNYDFLELNSTPCSESIESVSKKLTALEGHKFQRYFPHCLVPQGQRTPATQAEYNNMMSIFIKYDLNMFVAEKGPIFVALFNSFERVKSSIAKGFASKTLSLSQKVHLALLLICDTESLNCSPVWSPSLSAGNVVEIDVTPCSSKLLGIILKELNPWIPKMYKTVANIKNKIEKLAKTGKPYKDIQDKIGELSKELKYVENQCKCHIDELKNATVGKEVEKLRCKKLYLLTQLEELVDKTLVNSMKLNLLRNQ